MKNYLLAAALGVMLLGLAACGNEAPAADTLEERLAITPSITAENTEIVELEYDALQQIYLDFDHSTTPETAIAAAEAAGLPYTEELLVRTGYPDTISIRIAFTEGVASQDVSKEVEYGDYLNAEFLAADGSLRNCAYSRYDDGFTGLGYLLAVDYVTGVWYKFGEENRFDYSGLYVIDTEFDRDGLYVEYTNGKAVQTGYRPSDSKVTQLCYIEGRLNGAPVPEA